MLNVVFSRSSGLWLLRFGTVPDLNYLDLGFVWERKNQKKNTLNYVVRSNTPTSTGDPISLYRTHAYNYTFQGLFSNYPLQLFIPKKPRKVTTENQKKVLEKQLLLPWTATKHPLSVYHGLQLASPNKLGQTYKQLIMWQSHIYNPPPDFHI